MDNFEIEEAARLADTDSPYTLAKMLLIEHKECIELAKTVVELRGEISRTDRLLRASVRDEFKSATSPAGAVQNEIAKLEHERDELAAHVERLCAHIVNAEELHPAKWAVRGHKLIHNNPATSLAHRDLIQRAEGIYQAICFLESEFDPCHPMIERLESFEQQERSQAKETDQ